MNRPIVIGFLLFIVVFGVIFYFVKNRPETILSSTSTSNPPGAAAVNQRRINVKLYFSTPGSVILDTEERSIPYHETLNAQAKEVLAALIAGPKGKLIPSIPDGVRVLDVLVSKDGIAYVDLSGEIVSNHQGGTTGEVVTVYSIVNTLTINLPQIHGVQILVDDRPVETLKGHMDLSRPLRPDLSIARQEQESKSQEQNSL
ncbi:GerMN domain-containing protein [bacterium]|nr:GerMN domain-containing protein [bacterium]MCI0604196.1 GerMN domain-containing protein [bacterium]